MNNKGFNLGRILFVANPFMLDILKEAFCKKIPKHCHWEQQEQPEKLWVGKGDILKHL
jgi:hypothetical protein